MWAVSFLDLLPINPGGENFASHDRISFVRMEAHVRYANESTQMGLNAAGSAACWCFSIAVMRPVKSSVGHGAPCSICQNISNIWLVRWTGMFIKSCLETPSGPAAVDERFRWTSFIHTWSVIGWYGMSSGGWGKWVSTNWQKGCHVSPGVSLCLSHLFVHRSANCVNMSVRLASHRSWVRQSPIWMASGSVKIRPGWCWAMSRGPLGPETGKSKSKSPAG